MINRKFDCPKCGAKNSAVRSSYYPQIVVHKCDGKTLLEVGRWEKDTVIPVHVEIKTTSKNKIITRQFTIEKITDPAVAVVHGKTLKNDCSQLTSSQRYLRDGEIWVVCKQHSNTALYMILVKDKTIPDEPYFSGVDISPVPKSDGEEILKSLIQEKVIKSNPFPFTYKI
jgi:hypothetical protein